jgi:hypothetical protein
MKIATLIVLISLAACNGSQQQNVVVKDIDTTKEKKTTVENKPTTTIEEKPSDTTVTPENVKPAAKIYSNKRFRNVTVEKQENNKYLVKGTAQIFEASFSWVIEDGHEELQKGFAMTDAGAPEWGKFSFTVEAIKKRPNYTLHLILFESSAKDGSRQYELPILLSP